MEKKLTKVVNELFYYEDWIKVLFKDKPKDNIKWNVSNIRWNVSYIEWDVSDIRWDVSYIRWDVNYIRWDVSNIRWNVSNIRWDIDECNITKEDLINWKINIKDLLNLELNK
jgi:hypothetical protein